MARFLKFFVEFFCIAIMIGGNKTIIKGEEATGKCLTSYKGISDLTRAGQSALSATAAVEMLEERHIRLSAALKGAGSST